MHDLIENWYIFLDEIFKNIPFFFILHLFITRQAFFIYKLIFFIYSTHRQSQHFFF